MTTVRFTTDPADVPWQEVKRDLLADDFDNGRSPEELLQSFRASWASVFAWDGAEVVGMARLLADGVCNAYLIDVWTRSSHRRRGIATEVVRRLCETVPGHHILLTTKDAAPLYRSLGFADHPHDAMWRIVGTWLNR